MLRMPKILLLMLAMMMASAMPMLAKEQYVDPVFGDTIDRTAEDFVTVSLLVADPGTYLYSVFGHMCIRMQCPTFQLDNCYSYDMAACDNNILDFFKGKLKMGLFCYPTGEYCSEYAREGRGIYEYQLHLPPYTKQELWRILDETAAKGANVAYDYYNHSCAIECVRFIKRALGDITIKYDESSFTYSPTGRELGKKYTDIAPWTQFMFCVIAGSDVDVPLRGDKQLVIPVDVVDAWKKATINGITLLDSTPNVLIEGKPQLANYRFTPMLLAMLILCLSIANLFWSKPYFDWIMLATQTAVGGLLMYMIFISDICCTSWTWLLIPFNILPLIAWYWRKWWALPYACALIIWCGVMAGIIFWGRWLCGWPHIILVLAWTLVLIKQSLVRTAQ